MRIISILVIAAACSQPPPNAPHPINVALIRHEVQVADERPIVSVGHVTDDTAVVYTEQAGVRREETWQRGSAGWKLRDSKELARTP